MVPAPAGRSPCTRPVSARSTTPIDVTALFAHQAGVAIAYAVGVTSLSEAVKTRTLIGQAIGIAMERYDLNDERALAYLQRVSSHSNVKLRIVAGELVASSRDREAASDMS